MKTLNVTLILLTLLMLSLAGCSDLSDTESISFSENPLDLAIPITNTSLTIDDFMDFGEDSNVTIQVDEEGRVTLFYQGQVVRENYSSLVPPFPFFEFPILDSVFIVPLPFLNDQRIDKAVFGDTKIGFYFKTDIQEDIVVEVSVPQMMKDGEIFSTTFSIPYEGVPIEARPPQVSVKDYVLQSENNQIEFIYDARLSSGERILFDEASMTFDQIIFTYIEGYFGQDVFDINGSFITVGLLDYWVSGGLSFEDPKVNIRTQNAFGFPVRSVFNEMKVITTTNEELLFESEIIDNNIDFDYPTLDEIGEVKFTDFSFNKDNSNIEDLFTERVTRVVYDIDAQVNADDDTSILEFATKDGFFEVGVNVELPLKGVVNNLILQDTIDFAINEISDKAESMELKTLITNKMPADIEIQGYFINANEVVLDSLFADSFILEGAEVDASTGKTLPNEEEIHFETFDATRTQNLRSSERMIIRIRMNTTNISQGPLWIYNDYGIDFKAGAILTTKL